MRGPGKSKLGQPSDPDLIQQHALVNRVTDQVWIPGNPLLLAGGPADNGLHPTIVDKYNPMQRGETSLRDSKWFCSTHVTIDQATGQTAIHVDLVNPGANAKSSFLNVVLASFHLRWHSGLYLSKDR